MTGWSEEKKDAHRKEGKRRRNAKSNKKWNALKFTGVRGVPFKISKGKVSGTMQAMGAAKKGGKYTWI